MRDIRKEVGKTNRNWWHLALAEQIWEQRNKIFHGDKGLQVHEFVNKVESRCEEFMKAMESAVEEEPWC